MATPLASLDPAVLPEDDRTALTKEAFKHAFLDNLFYIQGKFPALATQNDYYQALAYAVRDRMLQRWISTAAAYTKQGSRTVAYLSAEFLMGPHLGNNLINLGIYDEVRAGDHASWASTSTSCCAQEEEPGLGNGGLGRLAACFIDSLATLEIPALGYGIRYEFGIFHQDIVDGWQVERTDNWLRFGNPWEIARPEWAVEVKLGGHTEQYRDEHGPAARALGAAQDSRRRALRHADPRLPHQHREHAAAVEGGGARVVRLLGLQPRRLLRRGQAEGRRRRTSARCCIRTTSRCRARSCASSSSTSSCPARCRTCCASCAVQKIPLERFHEKFAVQLNDTHPAIAVAELMRLLVDEHVLRLGAGLGRSPAARSRYTNHTLLPEALECWPLALFARVLPRHLEIIYEINARFLDEVRIRFPATRSALARLSLIDERGERYVRMAHLACVGSHAINGVAELHSELLKQDVLRDFHELWPERFSNKTNGVTPRRWLVLSNPRLAALITEAIGEGWIKRPRASCSGSSRSPTTPAFRARVARRQAREQARLRRSYVRERTGVAVDPDSLFDVQVKRIHEYKRQHLNILHVDRAVSPAASSDPHADMQPRTFIFGGKAAPGYHMAKLIIKLINAVGDVVNRDPAVRDRLKVVFLPNFNVQQRPAHLSGGGPVRADLDRRQGSVRHRQHEVLA